MPTPYVKQTWIDGVAGATPISAARLTYIENGIENATVEDGAYAGPPALVDAVLYVAQGGSDSNSGRSWDKGFLTLSAAITALPAAGGRIHVGAGTFTAPQIAFTKSNVLIQGAGQGVTILKLANAGHGDVLKITSATNVVVKDLTLDGNKANNTGASAGGIHGINFAGCTNCSAERVTSINSRGDGFYIGGIYDGADRRTVTDGVLNSTKTLTSATANFTAADVRKVVTGTGIPDGTTILTLVSPTEVTMTFAATATASGVSVQIGSGSVLDTESVDCRFIDCKAIDPARSGSSITGGIGCRIEGLSTVRPGLHGIDFEPTVPWVVRSCVGIGGHAVDGTSALGTSVGFKHNNSVISSFVGCRSERMAQGFAEVSPGGLVPFEYGHNSFVDCSADKSTVGGFYFDNKAGAAGAGTALNLMVIGCAATRSVGSAYGFFTGPGTAGALAGRVVHTNCRAFDNGGPGFVSNCADVTVYDGCVSVNNGRSGGGATLTVGFIHYAGTVYMWGCNARDSDAGTQVRGLYVNGAVVKGGGNLFGGATPVTGTPQFGAFQSVITATIGTTEVNVTHGLGYRPGQVVVLVKGNAVVWESGTRDTFYVRLTSSVAGTPVEVLVA